MSPRRTLIPLARGGLSAWEAQKEAEKVANSSTMRVMRMFNEFGDTDYIGEDFSIMVHSLQVARLAVSGSGSLHFCIYFDTTCCET